MTADVVRFRLENGLTVLVKEMRASPVAATLTLVDVGYFNEPDRWGGISHVVEHMVFKGTVRRPSKEAIAQEVRALGGSLNASTSYEETSYYIIVPSENIEQAIAVQADMLRAARIDPTDLSDEIEVIVQESRQKRDNPRAMLVETMYAHAYDRHRIRRWRIGEDEVLRSFRRDDLAEFMEQTYRPENMVVVVAGDVNAENIRTAIERCWGGLRRGRVQKEKSEEEPARHDLRFHRMRGEIQQRIMVAGFHAPQYRSADSPALAALDAVLADGRSSRLIRSLKEDRRLVTAAWADYDGYRSLGLFMLGLEPVDDDPLPAERALFEEARRVADSPPDEGELARIKTRMASRRVSALEEVLGVARSLAWFQTLGDYRIWDEMTARMDAVSAEDIARVAAQYVQPGAATIVEYLPAQAQAPERTCHQVAAELVADLDQVDEAAHVTQVGHIGEPIAVPLDSGVTLAHRLRQDLPLVAVHVLFGGGRRGETAASAGITNLMVKSMLKGTASMSAAEIAARVEALGSGIGQIHAPDYFGFSIKLLADRLADGLAVLNEVISKPVFPADEVDKEKESIRAEIRRTRDTMAGRAMELFAQAAFGDQPYGLPGSGIEEAIDRLTRDDLAAWHSRWVVSENAHLGIVGAVTAEEAAGLLSVPVGRSGGTEIESSPLPPDSRVASIPRQQTALVIGFPGASLYSDDRYALDMIAEITSGMAGRFFRAVRQDNALAYAVSGFHRSRRDAGFFAAYTATSPENEGKASEIILSECSRLVREPVVHQELADAKEALRGEHAIHMQTFSSQAAELAYDSIFGLPLNESEEYLGRISALTPDDVQAAAEKYLDPSKTWVGAVRGAQAG